MASGVAGLVTETGLDHQSVPISRYSKSDVSNGPEKTIHRIADAIPPSTEFMGVAHGRTDIGVAQPLVDRVHAYLCRDPSEQVT